MSAIVPRKTYLIVWIVLQLILGTIYGVSRIDMGVGDLVVPLVLAAMQTILVIFYFMHLRFSSRLNWVVIGGGFLWLLILVDLTLSDYITRGYIWWLGTIVECEVLFKQVKAGAEHRLVKPHERPCWSRRSPQESAFSPAG